MNHLKKEIMHIAWQDLKENISLWMIIMLFNFIIYILISNIQENFQESITIQSILFLISSSLFLQGINLGMLQIALNSFKKETTEFKQVFGSFDYLIIYVLATIVFLIVIFISVSPGLLLLYININNFNNQFFSLALILIIVPMIYLSIRFQLYNYFIIDKGCGPIESVKKSFQITEGVFNELFIIGAILSIIILISIIPLMIGLILSIPYATLVNTFVYLSLTKQISNSK